MSVSFETLHWSNKNNSSSSVEAFCLLTVAPFHQDYLSNKTYFQRPAISLTGERNVFRMRYVYVLVRCAGSGGSATSTTREPEVEVTTGTHL